MEAIAVEELIEYLNISGGINGDFTRFIQGLTDSELSQSIDHIEVNGEIYPFFSSAFRAVPVGNVTYICNKEVLLMFKNIKTIDGSNEQGGYRRMNQRGSVSIQQIAWAVVAAAMIVTLGATLVPSFKRSIINSVGITNTKPYLSEASCPESYVAILSGGPTIGPVYDGSGNREYWMKQTNPAAPYIKVWRPAAHEAKDVFKATAGKINDPLEPPRIYICAIDNNGDGLPN